MDDRLESMYRRFTWRILSNYVSAWEFEELRNQITDYEQWCATWCRQAASHVERGDEALAAGRRRTAGDAYLRAGLFYHWASFMFSHDQAQFRAALASMATAWEKAAPHVDPPMEILAVPFEHRHSRPLAARDREQVGLVLVMAIDRIPLEPLVGENPPQFLAEG